ncbi:MAG: hypothetical protein AB1Z19_08215 [Eubacteriales bacterium]
MMKRFLILLLIVTLIFSFAAPVAYADKGGNGKGNSDEKSNNGKSAEAAEKNAERKAAREELKLDFEDRKAERAELREMKKDQLAEQRELTKAYKQQLRQMLLDMEGLSEEEQAAMAEDIAILQQQIRDAQKYSLEIKAATKAGMSEIMPGVRAQGFPEEEEVEEIVEQVLDEL